MADCPLLIAGWLPTSHDLQATRADHRAQERASEVAAYALEWEQEAAAARGEAEASTVERVARSHQIGHMELRCRSLVTQADTILAIG